MADKALWFAVKRWAYGKRSAKIPAKALKEWAIAKGLTGP